MLIAYSYRRYSSPAQADGDSIRRQTALARAWCKRNDATLDTKATYEDRGRSAFKGDRQDALGVFLAEVEDGRIPRDSVLLLENMDRLARKKPVRAVNRLTGILLAGVRVVQLAPDELELTEDSDLFSLFRGQMALERGHEESKRKSGTVGEAWGERKQRARAKEHEPISARCPAWLLVAGQQRRGKHVFGGEYVLVADRAAVVRQIFDLVVKGYGLSLVVKKLTEDKVKPWGRGNGWSKAYVHKILTGRAVLGEYQPIKNGQADGTVIRNYYPIVVDETTWDQAQGALARRKDRPGRVGCKVASLFTGLLWDATTGGKMLVSSQTRGPKGRRQVARVLVSADSMEGRSASRSFPYPVFEEGVLSLLREVKAADVFGEEPESEAASISAELASVQQRRGQIEAELAGEGEDIPALVRVLKALDVREQELLRRLAVARQKDANPHSAAWAEARTLCDAAKDEGDRLRLRDLLRTTVEGVWVLIVPREDRPSHRLAAIQIYFKGDARREYLIHYHAAGYCREGGWWALSLAGVPGADALDLRDLVQAERFARELEILPLEGLT